MTDLDLSVLRSGPAAVLAPASDVRSRGDQRARRGRALVAASAALLVLAGAGTAVALGDRGSKPDALQTAATPTPEASSLPALPRDPRITWAAFPTVTDIAHVLPGDWTSGQIQVTPDNAEADRCGADVLHPSTRALVSRGFFLGPDRSLALTAQDYADAATAQAVFASLRSGYTRCPTVVTDGPGLGSQKTGTIVSSSAAAYTAREVGRQCRRDHADCVDSPWRLRVVRAGHLILTVRVEDSTGEPALESLATAFASTLTSAYGHTPPQLPKPRPVTPQVGQSAYAAFVWTNGPAGNGARDQAEELGKEWSPTLLTTAACLDGSAGAVEAVHGSVLALLFRTAQDGEDFVNLYDGWLEGGVRKVTVTCLDEPVETSPAPTP